MLWRADRGDSLPNLAGLTLLHIAVANNGDRGYGAECYISEVVEMAKRMQFFGVHDRENDGGCLSSVDLWRRSCIDAR
jgi:hypothetical protein